MNGRTNGTRRRPKNAWASRERSPLQSWLHSRDGVTGRVTLWSNGAVIFEPSEPRLASIPRPKTHTERAHARTG